MTREALGKAISLGAGMWPVPFIEPALFIADTDAHALRVRCAVVLWDAFEVT